MKVGEGLDAIDLCCGDERSDAAPGMATFIMTGEESVLSRQGERTDQVLDSIGDDFDAAVVEESLLPFPLLVDGPTDTNGSWDHLFNGDG